MLKDNNLKDFKSEANTTNSLSSKKSLSIFRLTKFYMLLLFLIISRLSFGQDTSSKIDKKDLKSFIKTLTSPQFGGRGIDNDGQIKTQEFIANRFKELQLEPFSSDGYLEKISLHQISRGEIFLKTQNNRRLQNFDHMIFLGGIQQNGEIERKVVYGGYGTEEELNQIDVDSCFVLIFLTNSRDEIAINNRLKERNANGIIFFLNNDENYESMKRRLKEYHLRKKYSIVGYSDTVELSPKLKEILNAMPIINSITVPESEVNNIIGLSKNKLISLADRGKIDEAPQSVIKLNFEQVEKTVETANVIGIIKGKSDKSIIISAHYDHLGEGENLYYPGADDNASGIAALIELAEELAQNGNLNYTMIFLATTAEESGLLGSKYYVEQPDFDPEKVICNVDIDMISRCDDKHTDCKYLYCIGNNKFEMLDSLVREADKHFPNYIFDYSENDSDIFARSDGASFMKKGIPTLMFFSGFHDDYHKPSDTMDKIDFTILENRIKLILEVIKLLQEKEIPI